VPVLNRKATKNIGRDKQSRQSILSRDKSTKQRTTSVNAFSFLSYLRNLFASISEAFCAAENTYIRFNRMFSDHKENTIDLSLTFKHLLSKYVQTFPVSKLSRFLLDLKDKRNFSREFNNLGVKCLIPSRSEKSGNIGPVFCIVHWNAPDFLLLNIKQLERIYPNNEMYVLDNGSQKLCLEELVIALKQFKNVRLFSVRPEAKSDHTLGLQFLLNYSAMQQNEFSVFLDQDCILCRTLDDLLMKFRYQKDLLLIGARDCVIMPKQHNSSLPWKRADFLRCAPKMVHPSLMILQPKKIIELFGHNAFSPHPKAMEEARDNKWGYKPYNERYYSISSRARGHILFLETKMHNEIPLLTSYSFKDVIYAYHAWYSSRTTHLSVQDSIDGIPVSLFLNIRKKAYEYMEQIHKSGTDILA
jgi:hypothetical protein